ncbi:stAR-related lipid transfer protein 9 [Anguilla rostrata]|uniref:stAR-related lipid transfer protein 9 n=1 Tax=Anguilla rostrata TaxID=7938 RepID=UPI0030D29D2B
MANVKVAIRVRPLSARESKDGGRIAVQVEDKVVRIRNMKLDGRLDGHADSRERLMEFGFDYCYWSVDPEASHYASQEEVFQDLGVSVLAGASEGYNVCLFAYGQTGSGKTYTMIGTPASIGLTPRICQGLFRTEDGSAEGQSPCRVEVSFLEIYNERVRDLLRRSEEKKPSPLRVREHPEKGPYVQGLSQHVVSDYQQAVDLLEEGISKRITAATHIHDASSRSHAIFSIQYTQAILENNLPSEIVSKINLVDLAGSERADPNYCRDRITEGSNINKSLVTLGIVISALAQNSQMFSSCQSINSVASEGEGSTGGSLSSSLSGGARRHCFIPYRDSVLTWLLKDSLGGNSRTIMIASECSPPPPQKPRLKIPALTADDASVRLIRELREEIDRLKSMLLSYEMQRNPSPSLSDERDGSISDLVLQNELKVEQLTKDWSDRWRDQKEVLEQYSVDINRDRAGFLIRSLLPHLIALDRDVLSTGVTFYHLREGVTVIGPHDQSQIVLQGESSCEIVNQQGTVTLRPVPGSVCTVNEREVTEPCRLAQGAVIALGGAHKFRFNHPAEAAVLRERRRESEGILDCCSTDLSPLASSGRPEGDRCWEEGGGGGDGSGASAAHPPRQRVEEQQRYIECLREEIQAEQQRAELELESEQAHLRQQHREIQQWILQEKQRLAASEEKGKQELGVQTDPVSSPRPEGVASEAMEGGSGPIATPLTATIGDRKRVVQEELLRHHALRRAENRVRRKRLHYQLERIAQKRHLLEAKRELQRLENALPPGQDSPTSPELGHLSRARGPPRVLRRHSFSADILSRLYPQHTPSFSHFLRRNKSSEFSPAFWRSSDPRKWVSDECLPSRRTRSRANTMPSEFSRSLDCQTSFPERLNASMRHVPVVMNGAERRSSLSKNGSIGSHGEASQSSIDASEQCSKVTKKSVSMSVKSSGPNAPKGVKSPSQGNKSLERIRKAFSRSVGPGIRTALSRVFRKPPSGFNCRGTKSLGKTANRSQENSELKETKVAEEHSIKMAVSCEDLKRPTSSTETRQRRWNSAEVLGKASEKPASRQWKLAGWTENMQEEQGDGSSDCDSSYSLDSLSSAYATALAEQLKQEDSEMSECDGKSEAESVDSQMSQDSLVTDSSKKNTTVRTVSKSTEACHQLASTLHRIPSGKERRVFSRQSAGKEVVDMLSSLDSCTSDDMPAEAYWGLCVVSQPNVAHKPEAVKEAVRPPKWTVVSREMRISEESAGGPLVTDGIPRPFSASSIREQENSLVSTDAWSSTETDSPRICRASTATTQRTLYNPAEGSSNTQSSMDLSDSPRSSESQDWSNTDCTEGEKTTVEQQKYWDSETSSSSSVLPIMLGDETMLASLDTITEPVPGPIFSEVSHFEGCSMNLSGKGNEGEATASMETSDCPKRCGNNQTENMPFDGSLCKTEAISFSACKSPPTPTIVCQNLEPDNEPVSSLKSEKLMIRSMSEQLQVGASESASSMVEEINSNVTDVSSKDDHSSSECTVQGENIIENLFLANGDVGTAELLSVNLSEFDMNTSCRIDEEGTPSSCPPEPQSNFNEGSIVHSMRLPCSELVQVSFMEESAVGCTHQNDHPDTKNTSDKIKIQTVKADISELSNPLQHVDCQDRKDMQNGIKAEGQSIMNSDSLITSGIVCKTDHFQLESNQNISVCTTILHSQTASQEICQVKEAVISYIPENVLKMSTNKHSSSTDHSGKEQIATMSRNNRYSIDSGEIVEGEKKNGVFSESKEKEPFRVAQSESFEIHNPSIDVEEAKVLTISKVEGEAVNEKVDFEVVDSMSCEMDLDKSKGHEETFDEEEWEDCETEETKDCLEKKMNKQYKPEKMAVHLKKGVIHSAIPTTYESFKVSGRGNDSRKIEKLGMHRGKEKLPRIPKKICTAEKNITTAAPGDSEGSMTNNEECDCNHTREAEFKKSPATFDLSNSSSFLCYTEKSALADKDLGLSTSQNNVAEICDKTNCFQATNKGLETYAEEKSRENERSPIDQEISKVVQKHMKASLKEGREDVGAGDEESSAFMLLNVHWDKDEFEESNPCALSRVIRPHVQGNLSSLSEMSDASEVKDLRDHLRNSGALFSESSMSPVLPPFIEIKPLQDDCVRADIANFDPEQHSANALTLLSKNCTVLLPKAMESSPSEKNGTSSYEGQKMRGKDINVQSFDKINYVQIGSSGKISSNSVEPATVEHGDAQMIAFGSSPMNLELKDSRQMRPNSSKATSIDDCTCITDTPNNQLRENVSPAANPNRDEIMVEERILESNGTKDPITINTPGYKTEGATSIDQSFAFRRDLTAIPGKDERADINSKQVVEQKTKGSKICSSPYLSDDSHDYKSRSNIEKLREVSLAHISMPALQPDGNYLENVCPSPTVGFVSQMREEKGNIVFPPSEGFEASAQPRQSCPETNHSELHGLGSEDYFDVRMSRWTGSVEHASQDKLEEILKPRAGVPDFIVKVEQKLNSDTSSKFSSSNSEHEDKINATCTLNTVEPKADCEHPLRNDLEGYLCSAKDFFLEYEARHQYKVMTEIPDMKSTNVVTTYGAHYNSNVCESDGVPCFQQASFEEIAKPTEKIGSAPVKSSPEIQSDSLSQHLRNSQSNRIKGASSICNVTKNFSPSSSENCLEPIDDQVEKGSKTQCSENCTSTRQTNESQEIAHSFQVAKRESSSPSYAQHENTEIIKKLLLEGIKETTVTETSCLVNVGLEFKNSDASVSSHSPSQMKQDGHCLESRVNGFGDREMLKSDYTGHPQCSNNAVSNADHQRGKQKRFRRVNPRAPSTSSTESMLDSSPEEKTISRVYPGRIQSRSEAQTPLKLDTLVNSRKVCSGFTKGQGVTSAVTKTSNELDDKPRNGGSRCQRQTHSNMRPLKPHIVSHVEKKSIPHSETSTCGPKSLKKGSHETLKPCLKQHELSVAKQEKVLQQESQTLPKKDAAMHFASSDINPFFHSWQETESTKGTYKNQVFGSATDISCKGSLLDDHKSQVTRCHSVDNGLNDQNSPFQSHLSAYANKKELSSSFEDFKEQDSSELQSCHYMSYPDSVQNPRRCDSYRNVVSGDLGNCSGQVDEIMLVYSSEQESVAGPLKDYSMLACDQSTQTTIVDSRQKKKNRHKRSSTQVPMTRMDTTGTGVPTTWASLQNMSLHLSELIYNTSDLLGNIQCIRAQESLPKTDRHGNVVAHPLFAGSGKRDCSTQTVVDIGIQTEGFPVLGGYRDITKKQIIEKPHEVNVIVKVIGSDVLSVSQDQEDIILNVQDRAKYGRTGEKMQSMPNLWQNNSGGAEWTHASMESASQTVRASTPSLVTNVQCYSCSNHDSSLKLSPRHIPEQVFSTNIGISRVSSSSSNAASQGNQTSLRDGSQCLSAHQKTCPKQVCFIDRASSPILTVESGTGTQLGRSKSAQCLVNHQKVEMQESVWEQHEVQSAPWRSLHDQAEKGLLSKHANREEQSQQTCDHSGKLSRLTSNGSIGCFTPENVSDLSEHSYQTVERCSVSLKISRNFMDIAKQQTAKVSKPSSNQSPNQSPRWATLPPYLSDGAPFLSQVSLVKPGKQDECPHLGCRQDRQEPSNEKSLLSSLDKQLSYSASALENYHRTFDDVGRCWNGPSEPSNISEATVQLQEDDAVSLAPSECNTDILININPLLNVSQKEHRRVPEDLPMHNKFTNWSGVSYHPPSIASSGVVQSVSKRSNRVKEKSSCAHQSSSESQGSGDAEVMTPKSRRTKEIEMLRKEREQVMAAVRLDMNPHQLTVELTEAKLHYGLGETDALLKLLKTNSKEEPRGVPTKQQLYDQHRRSIEGLRQEREARLQTCRRARSLSPSKHLTSQVQGAETPTRGPELPSRRREYLQQLRQEVVESTRVPEPPKQAGQWPSEIELMLRDYGRAREEARTEIARARDRLRERTEQEKRRLQQQALSRAVKDDLRSRTRVSSSTLCTGSSLSLSSGPTSGYNSSNTALLKEGANSAQVLQVPGCPEDGGLKVRGRPPIRASQNFELQRPWLSVQDVRLEVPVSGTDSQLPSPCGHHRTLSHSSAFSISTSYRDIAKYTHDCAIAEVRSAAAGDLGNLLEGRASSGWRYQGTERGVQAFYKPSSSPSVYGFLGAVELERPLPSLWCMIRDHSKAHLYNESVRSAWTRPLDDSTQLVYLLTDTSACHLSQPRDFCCISTESKQQGEWVLAMRSVFEESLPRPSIEAVRGELLPSAWVLQPALRQGREVIRVIYLLQVDLGTPALPQRILSVVARKQAAVIAELDTFLSL